MRKISSDPTGVYEFLAIGEKLKERALPDWDINSFIVDVLDTAQQVLGDAQWQELDDDDQKQKQKMARSRKTPCALTAIQHVFGTEILQASRAVALAVFPPHCSLADI